jgi:Flp pilus assembly protein TadG
MAQRNDSMTAGWRDEAGVATPVEMMYLLVFCIAAVLFLGFVGRLQAAGVQVTNTAQSAARAASQAPDSATAQVAAEEVVALSPLRTRCEGGADVIVTWVPSPVGAWQGGSVTVHVSCTVRNQALTGVWAPGAHTVTMDDTQPVDRYQR